ncbi:MAG: AAA family ATPase [Lentisphaerae bacterium]|nr:AAA family ATPase [Lentisphaerota bacterium]
MNTQTLEALIAPQIDEDDAAADTAGQHDNPLMALVEATPQSDISQSQVHFDIPREADFVGFYGMRDNPFADSINPAYFFRIESHRDVITRMLMAVRYNVSLGMVTGESGAGKTLVSQILLQNIDQETHQAVLVLVTPGMSKTALLRTILSELNIALPTGIVRTQDLVRLLTNHVIDLYQEGRRLVIVIDECHFLTSDSLHILRTVSNIEIPECKLVTCLLFGESRFAKRLENPSYDSLRNRMYLQCQLQPLTLEEVAHYVSYRLSVAGRSESLFDDDALALLHERSGGIARSLSKLCMLSLLEGALSRSPRITRDIAAVI